MDDANSVADLAQCVNILDAISWLHLAWAGVSEECVCKCFAQCGFLQADDEVTSVEQTLEPDEASQVLLGDVAWHDYVAMDDAIHTTDVDDNDEVTSVEQTLEPDEASQVLLGDVAWHDYVAMDDAIHTTDVDDNDEVTSVEQTLEPDEASQVLLGDVAWHDYVAMDDAIHTTDVDDNDWEAALVAKVWG